MLLKQYPRTGPCHTTVLTKGKQTQKQNITSLFYWEWCFSNLRHFICVLMQLLKISLLFLCSGCRRYTHQLLYNSNLHKYLHSLKHENWLKFKNEFSFLTNRNTFKWSLKITTIIGIHCKNGNFNKKLLQVNSEKNILRLILFLRYFIWKTTEELVKHIRKLRHILQQISSQN